MEKAGLRQHLLTARLALSPGLRSTWDLAAQGQLIASNAFAAARTLLLYMPFRGEVATSAIADTARAAGKRVVLPKVVRSGHGLTLHQIDSDPGDLAPGAFGILEPRAGTPQVARNEIDLVVVPGVAFDRQGGRLGYGGGYYDRLLADLPTACKLGLAYALQVVDRLPREPHDVPMDGLATERGFWIF